jgi:hypothetical protein
MKNAAACGPSSLATAGMMFSFLLRMRRKCASSISSSTADSIKRKGKVARPFGV